LPLAVVATGLDKKCSGLALTTDESKADYLLEASTTTRGHSHVKAQFTLLSKRGDVLFHTTTDQPSNAMKDVCKAIGLDKKK